MWEIIIQNEAIKSLKTLTKESSKTLFLFLNEYLPKDLDIVKINDAKIKELKGIHLFPKETHDGMVHLFLRIDFDTKIIKVLHLNVRLKPKPKKKKA